MKKPISTNPASAKGVWQDALDASEAEGSGFHRYLYHTYARMVLGVLVTTVVSCLFVRNGPLLVKFTLPFYPFLLIALVVVLFVGRFTIKNMDPLGAYLLYAFYLFLWALVFSPLLGVGFWIDRALTWLFYAGRGMQTSGMIFSFSTAILISLGFAANAAVFAVVCYFASKSSEQSTFQRVSTLIFLGLLLGLISGAFVGGWAILLFPFLFLIYSVMLFFVSRSIVRAYNPKDEIDKTTVKSIHGSFALIGMFFGMPFLIFLLSRLFFEDC